jgi:hypothetical protein
MTSMAIRPAWTDGVAAPNLDGIHRLPRGAQMRTDGNADAPPTLARGTALERSRADQWRLTPTAPSAKAAIDPAPTTDGNKTACRAAQLSRRRSRVRVPSLAFLEVPASGHVSFVWVEQAAEAWPIPGPNAEGWLATASLSAFSARPRSPEPGEPRMPSVAVLPWPRGDANGESATVRVPRLERL